MYARREEQALFPRTPEAARKLLLGVPMNFPELRVSRFAPPYLRTVGKCALRILLGALTVLLPLSALPGDALLQTVLVAQRFGTPPSVAGDESSAPTAEEYFDAELQRINTLLVLHTHGLSTSIDESDVMRRRGMLIRAGSPVCGSVEPLGAVPQGACSRLVDRVTVQ